MSPKEKLTVAQVADVIDSEGIGYAVLSYLSSDHIADPHLAQLWNNAEQVLRAIEQYVGDSEPDFPESIDFNEDFELAPDDEIFEGF